MNREVLEELKDLFGPAFGPAEEAIGRNPRFLQAEHRDQPALEDLRAFWA